MEKFDSEVFFKWLEKVKCTETDIIRCRKMQYMSITESETTFGITTVAVCGFIDNDVVRLGGDIKQRYDEQKTDYYERAYTILMICAQLMDSVNVVLADYGAWGEGYFQKKMQEWKDSKKTKNEKEIGN